MSAKHKVSIVDVLKKLPPRPRTWKALLTEEQMAEMEELRSAYRRGELRHLTLAAMLRVIHERFGIKIHRSSFSDWLNEKEGEWKERKG